MIAVAVATWYVRKPWDGGALLAPASRKVTPEPHLAPEIKPPSVYDAYTLYAASIAPCSTRNVAIESSLAMCPSATHSHGDSDSSGIAHPVAVVQVPGKVEPRMEMFRAEPVGRPALEIAQEQVKCRIPGRGRRAPEARLDDRARCDVCTPSGRRSARAGVCRHCATGRLRCPGAC